MVPEPPSPSLNPPPAESTASATHAAAPHSRLFDLRHLLAGVLGLYGLILLGVSFSDTPARLAKADGLPINLWMGLALAAVAAVFAVWAALDRPKPTP